MLYLHRYTWLMVRPELKEEYGFSELQLDGLYTLFNVTYMFGQIPGGVVCDYFGPHVFLGIIIALWSLAMPTIGMSGSMNGLGASRLAFGAAQAGCYPAIAKVTRVWFPLKGRTILQGLIASFFGRSGGAVSTVIFGVMLGVGLSWRSSLMILSAVGLGFAFLFYWICRNSPEEDPQANQAEVDLIHAGEIQTQDAPRLLPLGRAIRNRSLRVFVVQQFLNAGADYVYSALMASYFIEARNVSDKVILGLLASLPLWGGALGGIAGGFINDGLIARTGNRRLSRSIVGFSGKAIACVCLYLSITHSVPMVGAWLLFATKFFSDWTQPTVWGTSTDMGGRYSATVFSVINSAGSAGGVVTPLIGGFLLDRFATQDVIAGETIKVVHYEPVFLLVGVMYMLSAVCWLFINCTNSLDQPEYTATDDEPNS